MKKTIRKTDHDTMTSEEETHIRETFAKLSHEGRQKFIAEMNRILYQQTDSKEK